MTHIPPEHDLSSRAEPQDHPEIEVSEARQGPRGSRILWILLISVGAAAILLMALLAINGRGLERSNIGESLGSDTVIVDRRDEGPSPTVP